MNVTLVSALLRQRLASPMRVFMLFALFVPGLVFAVFTNTFAAVAGGGYWFALVFAAGAIGQDVSSGVLHLTFARPVTRTGYVTSRWFAAAAGGFAVALVRLLLATTFLAMRGAAPEPLALAAAVAEDAVLASVAAAVMVMFSALAGGLGDVAIFALATLGLQISRGLTQLKGWTTADRVVVELQHTLQPALSLAFLAGQGAPAWSGLAAAASTVTLALAIAIVAVNRKELSYAAD
jgi:ABC-type transport system involved in multi-copper enzyme maturation permease subunit